MNKKELLVPVGNKDILKAAINNGADAVYLGGKRFGARAYANNFSDEEMIEAINLCHLFHVKIYVTVNTMIYNREVKDVLNYLNFLYENNVDAVIMQDIGLIKLARKYIPNLEIHVSTQAHNHNLMQMEFYKNLGIKRVVFDREMSLEEIETIPNILEKEIFVYGALCVSYSGNCLFSALNGGRSANRGMCAQACRMKYQLVKNNKIVDNGYLFSMKDLNTLDYLKSILASSVSSLKIEGRMKSKEYVAVVTRLYRRLIDDYYAGKELVITDKERLDLRKTFNREFTKGHLFKDNDLINKKAPNHQGVVIGEVIKVNNKKITIRLSEDVHQGDAIRFEKNDTGLYLNMMYDQKGRMVNSLKRNEILEIDNKQRVMSDVLKGSRVLKTVDYLLNKELENILDKKIELTMFFKGKIGENIYLKVSDGIYTGEAYGEIVTAAISRPLEQDKISSQLQKLGSTCYKLGNLQLDVDDNIFINLKALNELRRDAVFDLQKNIEMKKKHSEIKNINFIEQKANKAKYSILVRNEEQLKIALKEKMDYIYVVKKALYLKYKSYENVYWRLERVNLDLEELSNERLLCTELGSIVKYGKNNEVRSDYYLNVANDATIKELNDNGARCVCLSGELNVDDLNEIETKYSSEIIVYGTLECMIIKGNIFHLENNDECYLVSNKQQKYKVFYDGYTHIMNWKAQDLRKDLRNLKGFGIYRVELLDENVSETEEIINSIKNS